MNKFICEFCLENFKSLNLLVKHQKTFKKCIEYRDIFFTCKKCNFCTVGIKNIDNHKCNKTVVIETDDNNEYIIEDSDVEDNNIEEELSLQKKIIKLENELKKERIKNETLSTIIDKYLSQKIISVPDEINIDLSVPKNTTRTQPASPCNSEDDKTDTKKTQFKTYKILKNNCIDLVQEPDNDIIQNKIKEIDIKIYNSKHNFGNLEHCNTIFGREFDTIKSSKTYNKNLDTIKNTRKKLLGALSVSEYINLLNKHVSELKKILEIKGHQDKKISSIITKSLGSLDSRFIYYGNYYDIPMDIDEFVRFKTSIQIFTHSPSFYVQFNYQNFINKFYNYGSVIIPLKECIEYYIINRYGFNNIVYIPLKQSSEDDTYSFYILEDIIKEKRYWKMDCRLIDLSDNIIRSLKEYLTVIFRKIYQDIFHDNDYREDYQQKTSMTAVDFVQLLKNILLLSDKREFYKLIKEIIIKNATYIPTENDKFNLYRDDPILKKKMQNIKDEDKSDSIKLLFDNITSEQAVDLYRSIKGCL
jgi:hypothetical protein